MPEPTHDETKRALDVALYALTLSAGEHASHLLDVAAEHLGSAVPVEQERRDGAALIAAERRRQVEAEGWTPEHDDEHEGHDLTLAAESYLWVTRLQQLGSSAPMPQMWPWAESWWKPSDDPIRNLVRSGALIAAELDRLLRLAAVPGSPDTEGGKA